MLLCHLISRGSHFYFFIWMFSQTISVFKYLLVIYSVLTFHCESLDLSLSHTTHLPLYHLSTSFSQEKEIIDCNFEPILRDYILPAKILNHTGIVCWSAIWREKSSLGLYVLMISMILILLLGQFQNTEATKFRIQKRWTQLVLSCFLIDV